MMMSRIKSVFLASAIALSLQAFAAPQLVWLNPRHDFGAFNEEMGPVSCTFYAVNTGNEPVVVLDARANCGCTRPSYPRQPIAPGDTLRVSVSFDPAGRPGRFSKQVKVSANTGSTAVLGIRGTVIGSPATLRTRYPEEIGPYRASNRIAAFGETTKGHVLASAVNIYNPTADSISPSVADMPPYLNALFRPEKIAPGEQGTLSLTAYTDRTADWGLIEGAFRLIPDQNHPEQSALIETVMIVNEDFSKLTDQQREKAPAAKLSESTLDFGRISCSDGVVSRELIIENLGRSPLEVRRIYTPQKGVSFRLSSAKIKPGKTAKVVISINPSQLDAADVMVNGRLTVIVNDPADPTRIVRIVGEIIP